MWESAVAQKIALSPPDTREPFTITTAIPAGRIYSDAEADEKLAFRAMSAAIRIQDSTYTLVVGMPIENPVADLIELLATLAIGFCASAIILFMLSYWLSGRILKPISEINRLAGLINDKTLAQRIPLGKNRDELYRLSETLNSMFDRLQFSFDKQKQFLADASHELKNPVALLKLKAEEYLQRADLPEDHQSSLIELSETLHRLSRLINSLLDLSALEHTTLRLKHQEIVLSRLVTSVLDDFAEAFHARRLTIHKNVPDELIISGDPENLRRVIVNLVDNAIKYNEDDGSIEIKGSLTDSQVCLSVGNTGAGIPEAELPHIFDQFYRLEKSRSAAFGGVGLGLTIVKRIVELHGGNVTAYSAPGQWTRMDILFARE
jgi:signal transduction histidine kinase